jgi:hypothetical protein
MGQVWELLLETRWLSNCYFQTKYRRLSVNQQPPKQKQQQEMRIYVSTIGKVIVKLPEWVDWLKMWPPNSRLSRVQLRYYQGC